MEAGLTVASRVSVIAPDADELYARGRQLRARGDDAGAEARYREALGLRPDFVDAWISLGILLRQSGRLVEAETAQRAALRIEPGNFLAHLNLGNALRSQNRAAEAQAEFRAAVATRPDCAEAHNNLGRTLLDLGRPEEAGAHFLDALRIDPRYFEALQGIGETLLGADQPVAAQEPLTAAHRIRPDDPATQRLLGRACAGAGDYSQAARMFERLLQRSPGDRDARFDLALAQFYAGQYSRPRATLEALLGEAPDDFVSMAYASLLLRTGEFREGWKHYGSRWALGEPRDRGFAEPRWNGAPIPDQTLLIAREQGLGDEIMFASILPEVLPLVGHCVIECDRRLAPLYRRSFPGATVFGVSHTDADWHTRLDAARGGLPRFDCWLPLGDLARLRRGERTEFPRHGGYLLADPARTGELRAVHARSAGEALKVGIGWRGGTMRTRSASRSLSLGELTPILRTPGCHFVSLQYGAPRPELEALTRETGLVVHHSQENVDDIDALASLIASLDLVINVCSANVHLAGALGRPAWVMTPLVPEWRYGHEGESMIWYPSVRQFRQEKARDWTKVIGNVRRALARIVA